MRLITTAVLLLSALAVPATAEPPPPQAAVAAAPGVTVSDASYNVVMPAVTATQPDTSAAAETASSTSSATIDTARAEELSPQKSDGHGLGFWSLVAGACILAAVGLYVFFTRRNRVVPSASTATSNVRDYDDRPPPRRNPRE